MSATALVAPSQNGSDPHDAPRGTYSRIAEIINDIPAEIAALEAERERIHQSFQERIDAITQERHATLAEIDEKRKQLNGLLRAMGRQPVVTPAAPKRRRSGAKRTHYKFSAPKACIVIESILAQEEKLFTAQEIHESVNADWHDSTTYNIIAFLREAEFVGAVRKESGRGPRARMLYRILDRPIGERLLAEYQRQAGEER